MSNLFLKVDKDLFSKGLNPTQILIVAQVEEFMRTTGDCHVTDTQFAEMLGLSTSTISREVKKLCEIGIIQKETKNIQHGKVRNLFLTNINLPIVENDKTSTTVNLPIAETSNCLLRTKQNDLIKDNSEKKIEKDKEAILSFADAQDKISSTGELSQEKKEFKF